MTLDAIPQTDAEAHKAFASRGDPIAEATAVAAFDLYREQFSMTVEAAFVKTLATMLDARDRRIDFLNNELSKAKSASRCLDPQPKRLTAFAAADILST